MGTSFVSETNRLLQIQNGALSGSVSGSKQTERRLGKHPRFQDVHPAASKPLLRITDGQKPAASAPCPCLNTTRNCR